MNTVGTIRDFIKTFDGILVANNDILDKDYRLVIGREFINNDKERVILKDEVEMFNFDRYIPYETSIEETRVMGISNRNRVEKEIEVKGKKIETLVEILGIQGTDYNMFDFAIIGVSKDGRCIYSLDDMVAFLLDTAYTNCYWVDAFNAIESTIIRDIAKFENRPIMFKE